MEDSIGRLRIGISMRVTVAADYYEKRDSLSQDWQRFLLKYLPGVSSLPLANVGSSIITNVVKPFRINAFILTGGDDEGVFPERDNTELAILTYAIENHLPVLAVCRGFQLLQTYCGGELSDCDSQAHMGTHHKVNVGEINLRVNSYHAKSIRPGSLASNLKAIAFAPDGGVEAAVFKNEAVLALMWHPERENRISQFECELIRQLFFEPLTFKSMEH